MPSITSIRTRLLLTLGLILLLSFIATGVANYMVSKRSLRVVAMEETLPLIADSVRSELQRHLLRPVNISSLMANDTFLKDWVLDGEQDIDKVVNYLKQIKEKYGFFTSFFVSAQTGHYYFYNGILKTMSPEDEHDVWYYSFKNRNISQELDVDTNEAASGALTIFINHRLEGPDRRFLGVTGVGLKLTRIRDLLGDQRRFKNRVIYMVDANGLIQVHPDQSLIEKTNIADLPGIGHLAAKILASKEDVHSYVAEGAWRTQYITSLYFPEFDWFLIVQQDESTALGKVRATFYVNLAVGLAATFLVIVLVFWTVNMFQGKLEEMAVKDGLTGLFNRRHFMELAGAEAVRVKRYDRRISLLLLDVDHFKNINDRHGHGVGDEALKLLAKSLQFGLREQDVVGRIGGEEFAVMLPETDLENACLAAERIRKTVELTPLVTSSEQLTITISIGAASARGDQADIDDLCQKADQAMYQAKTDGRNRVRSYHPEDN